MSFLCYDQQKNWYGRMFPFDTMYTLLPIMASVFPVLLAVVLVCCIEEDHPELKGNKPPRNYKCWIWYLIAGTSLALLPMTPTLRNLTQSDSVLHYWLGYTDFAIFSLAIALTAIGIWQPLWQKGSNAFRSRFHSCGTL